MPRTTRAMQAAFIEAVAPFRPLITSVMHGEHEGARSGPNEDPHYAGRAVDVGAFGGTDVGWNTVTWQAVMSAIGSRQFQAIGTIKEITSNPTAMAWARANGVDLFEDDAATGASGNHVHFQVAP